MNAAIIARLGLDSASFKHGLAQAERSVGSFGKNLSAALGPALSIGAMAAGTKAVIDFAGELQDSADALGMNVEAMQQLQFAFGQSGAGAKDVDKGLLKLTQSLNDARTGNEKTVASFARLGVTWRDIQTLTPDEILMKLADGLKDAKDPAAALSAVLEVLGKSGGKMAAGLKGGNDELRRLRDEAKVLTEDQVAELDAAGDALSGFFNKIKVMGGGTLAGLKELFTPLTAEKIHKRFDEHNLGPASPEELAAARAAAKAAKVADPSRYNQAADAQVKEYREAMDKAEKEASKLWNDLDEFKRKATHKRIDEERKQNEDLTEEAKNLWDDLNAFKLKAHNDRLDAEKAASAKAALEEADLRAAIIANRAGQILRGPHAAVEDRRAARKQGQAEAKANREANLRARGGRAEVDVDREPLNGALKPRLNPRDFKPMQDRGRDIKSGLDRPAEGQMGKEFLSALDESKMAADIKLLTTKLLHPGKAL